MISKIVDEYRNLPVTSHLKIYNVMEQPDYTKFLNVFRSYSVINNTTDIFTYYVVTNDEWFDSIAYKFYKNSKLWWAVAVANGVINPFEFLNEGDTIKVIKNQYLFIIFDDMTEIERL